MGYNENVVAGKTVSATIQYSNLNDNGRAFDIVADVKISNEKVSGFDNGVLQGHGEDIDPMGNLAIANFTASGDNYLNVSLSNFTENKALQAMTAIYEFMSSVRNAVEK